MNDKLPVWSSAPLLIVLISLILTGCRRDLGPDAIDTRLIVKLVQSSSIPTLEEIAPYEEALVINEYHVSKVLDGPKPDLEKIRIAHWAVTNKKVLPVLDQADKSRTLWITSMANMPELEAVYKRNDLDFDSEVKLYYDLTPIPESFEPSKNIRFDYRSDLSRRMKVFWLIRNQLKMVALGNSHTAAGVNTQKFYQPGNSEIPVALNMAAAGSGAEFQCLIANKYLPVLPELEWVVWGVSPRIFNQRYSIDRRAKIFKNSPGYLYDDQHWEDLISQDAHKYPLTALRVKKTLTTQLVWGWTRKREREFSLPLSAEVRANLIKKTSKRDFKWNPDAWTQFSQAVEKLTQRKIRVLLFTPPYHPLVTQTSNTDGDGTGRRDYDKIVVQLQALSQELSGVYFLDSHNGGQHEFKAEHFFDIDHLHVSGADILTEKLVNFVEKTDKPPTP